MRARTLLLLFAATLVVLVSAAGGAFAWLFYTEAGLAWLLPRAARYAGEQLTLEGPAGTLAGGAQVRHIRYTGPDLDIRIRDAGVRVSPWSIVRRAPVLTGLTAMEVAVVTKPDDEPRAVPDSFALPMGLQVGDGHIARLTLDLGTGAEPIDITDVRLRNYAGGAAEHRVEALSFTTMEHSVVLRGAIGANPPFPVRAAASARRHIAPEGTAQIQVGGTLMQMDVSGVAESRGAQVKASANVRPYEPAPLDALTAQVMNLNLRAFVEGVPRTAIAADIAVKRVGDGYTGPVRITNALAGPYDKERLPVAALRTVARTDLKVTRLTDLVLDLGAAGTLRGAGEINLQARRVSASLATERLDLAGIHTQLRPTALAGRADVAATEARQSVTADLREGDIALALTAHHEGGDIEIPKFLARAHGGEASGAAQVSLAGARPYSLKADFVRFDPAAWGDFPAGRINGTVNAKGTIDGPVADVQFAVRDSRLFDAPLAGKGAVSLAGERLRHMDVDVTLGGNHVLAKGTLGTPEDTLAVAFDAPNPGLLVADLQGRLRGKAQLSGAWEAPGVRFEITATKLAHPQYGSAGALSGSGQISGGWQKPAGAVTFKGSQLAHPDYGTAQALSGNVALSGMPEAPVVRFDLTGSELAHVEHGAVKALKARGMVGTRAQDPLEIDATLKGIRAAALELELTSAAIQMTGTRAAHTAAMQARGKPIDLTVRASGGWDPKAGWSGTVHELVNRGDIPLQLLAPVALTVGPQRAHTEPFALRVMKGQLNVSELRYEKGRVSTAGNFSDLPLGPVLTLAGGPADLAGTLHVEGNWSITNVPALSGSLRVARQSGDVTIENFRLRLRALEAAADLDAKGLSFRATLASALGDASAQGRIGAVANGEIPRITGASPLALTADVRIAQLWPVAALIETAMVVRGEGRALIKASGTVADPVITGTITADRLALGLPAEGINLQDGTLRAQLTPKEVLIDAFTIRGGAGTLTAQGRIARARFDEAALTWQAQHFTLLDRPDRRLVVTGKGILGLDNGRVVLKGSARADEGLIELAGAGALPRLGEDVVIAGMPAPGTAAARIQEARGAGAKPPAPGLERAVLDFNIDLGNNVLVRGHGLQTWLAGDLRLFTDARGEIRAKGTVETRRGFFAAYGQRLEIERGRVFFDGPLTNPGLDVLALRRRLAVEPGVQVTGTLDQPIVRVVSNPPLPEGEALSWLVLGRAPDTAQPGELDALPLVTTAILGRAGVPIARAFGLDEVGLRAGASPAEQFLTVGRRLTDRLYVGFEQGLGTAGSLLRLEYTLSPRLVARVQTGETSIFGLFYRRAWD
jgi:translocation and assembly module TamB